MECDISPYLEELLCNETNEDNNENDFPDFQFCDEDFLQPFVNSFLKTTNNLDPESKNQQQNFKAVENIELNPFLDNSILATDDNDSDNIDCFVSVLGVDLVFAYNSNSENYNLTNNYLNLDKTDSVTDLLSCKNFSTIFENDYETDLQTIENASLNDFPYMVEEKNIRRRSLIYERPSSQSFKEHHTNDDPKPSRKYTFHKDIDDSKYFMCSVVNCNKVYSKASHLKAHLKRHLGEKPFVCNWEKCTWKFSRSDELARHRRSHLGIKPYKCSFCEKAFSRSDHLTKHYKVHKKKMAFDITYPK